MSNINLQNLSTNTLLVSAIFGAKFSKLWRAVDGYRCVLFTNNLSIREEAEKKGWEFVFVEKFELSDDFRVSSLQSKYVKFLQFFKDYPEFGGYEKVVYFDHKNVFSSQELERILGIFKEDKKIFMLSSLEGWSAKDELKSASIFPRYKEFESETRDWIDQRVKAGQVNWDAQVYATSFIAYKNIQEIMPFLDEVYRTLLELRQPQCQVIWAVLIEGHKEWLQSIHWVETSMYRKTPLPFPQSVRRFVRHSLRKVVAKILTVLGMDYEEFRRRFVLKILKPSVK